MITEDEKREYLYGFTMEELRQLSQKTQPRARRLSKPDIIDVILRYKSQEVEQMIVSTEW